MDSPLQHLYMAFFWLYCDEDNHFWPKRGQTLVELCSLYFRYQCVPLHTKCGPRKCCESFILSKHNFSQRFLLEKYSLFMTPYPRGLQRYCRFCSNSVWLTLNIWAVKSASVAVGFGFLHWFTLVDQVTHNSTWTSFYSLYHILL